jgi:predicted oxidoreductase
VTEAEIIDKVYDNAIEQAAIVLFHELINDDRKGWHAKAERNFRDALKANAMARERAKILLGSKCLIKESETKTERRIGK